MSGEREGPGPETMRVFVNERGVDVARGGSVRDAVRAADGAEADRVDAGDRVVVDSRGLPADPHAPAYAGAIYRTIGARRAPDAASRTPADGDDDPA